MVRSTVDNVKCLTSFENVDAMVEYRMDITDKCPIYPFPAEMMYHLHN